MILSPAEVISALNWADTLTSNQQAIVNMLLGPVQRSLEARIFTRLEQRTFTEYLPIGDDRGYEPDLLNPEIVNGRVLYQAFRPHGKRFSLGNVPVRSITSLNYDPLGFAGQGVNAFASDTLMTGGVDYYLDSESDGFCKSGDVIRVAGTWSNAPRSIKVVYVAGYTAPELNGDPAAGNVDASDARLALLKCMLASVNATLLQQKGGVVMEGLADFRAQYNQDGVTLQVVIPGSALKDLQRYVNYGGLLP